MSYDEATFKQMQELEERAMRENTFRVEKQITNTRLWHSGEPPRNARYETNAKGVLITVYEKLPLSRKERRRMKR